MFKNKKSNLKITLTLLFTSVLITTSCQPVTQNQTNSAGNVSNSAANASTNSNQTNANAAPRATEKAAVKLPVTLPVLDAMFYDEGFTSELKTEVGLTDEEIEKLKTASGEAVANLGEGDEDSRSTRAATKRAGEQIQSILGAEKSEKLFALVNRRWTAGEIDGETALSSKPNQIPADTRIVVNAPAYRMDVFRDGQLAKTYKIGIGYPEFPLPNGLRKASTIIFNPTWTPPDEPWVKGKFKPYKKVDAGSKLNPLGVIKIPIGLPSLIHGGKQTARLGTFASHGCVGLTNAQVKDFSLLLAEVSGTQISDEDLKTYEKEKDKTKNVELAKTVPVELRYETIVVENGKLKIYRDVYEHGTNTEENLRKVLETYGVSLDQLAAGERQQITDALRMMNTDAAGETVSETSNSNQNNSNTDKNKQGTVTKNIKGKKEIEIPLPALNGKGYPAPVALNTGA